MDQEDMTVIPEKTDTSWFRQALGRINFLSPGQ